AISNEKKALEHELKQARAAFLPSVSVDAGAAYENRRAPITNDESVEFARRELGLQASQLVFDGFAASSEVARQQARLESIRYEERAEIERIALRVTEVYLDLLRQAEILELTRGTLWEHQNIYDQMNLRSLNGVGSKADLAQISARLALANANTLVAQANLTDSQTNFYRVVGVYPNLESMSKPAPFGEIPETREQVMEKAIADHPVLLGAGADVSAASAQRRAAKSRFMPRVTLEADRRWDDNIGGLEGEDNDLIVALRLRYDLYAGGANIARKKQTAYLFEAAKEVRNNSRRQVMENVGLSWNAYQALALQIPYLQQHIEAAKTTKQAYAKQFNIGRRTLLDLLNSETEVVEAKRALVDASYDSLYARSRILNSMGALVSNLEIGVAE
nr:TolC family outer membrane protein [Cellvibrionaceae bacterium]